MKSPWLGAADCFILIGMKWSERGEGKRGSRRDWLWPFWLALAGGMLVWASFPPLGWSPLVWLAPIPWMWLVRPVGAESPARPAGGDYLRIWLGSAFSWLLLLEGIRRAHPANYAGLLALASYVAAYLPVFLAVTRWAVVRWRIPLYVAAPIVWTGLELARGHLLTGFSMALLGHAVAEWTWLIQIADLGGAYAVSFVVMLVAAAAASSWPSRGQPWRWRPLAVAAGVLGLVALYGGVRMASNPAGESPRLSVALLQGTRDKVFEVNPELDQQTHTQYTKLMAQARDAQPDLDLIVWPEATFTAGGALDLTADRSATPPPELGLSSEEFQQRVTAKSREFQDYVAAAAQSANRIWRDGAFEQGEIWQLAGAQSIHLRDGEPHLYNSALIIDPQGNIAGRYYKMHLVMFGEYIPLGDTWPWIYRLTPMPRGMSRGQQSLGFEVNGFLITPSVCFEVTVPHLLRRHVRELEAARGRPPDVLVNATDDGWFWGSAILDYQLACGIFRAVEMRRPMLVAANTGISAWIDGNGHIVRRAPKRQEAVILAQVARDERGSLYRGTGDVFAGSCLTVSIVWIMQAIADRLRQSNRKGGGQQNADRRPRSSVEAAQTVTRQ